VSEGWPDGTPAWTVGDRVVVRRRLRGAEVGDHLWTDVIGVVLALDDAGVTLQPDPARPRPEGAPAPPTVRVEAADVVAAKRVPPRPVRRPSHG